MKVTKYLTGISIILLVLAALLAACTVSGSPTETTATPTILPTETPAGNDAAQAAAQALAQALDVDSTAVSIVSVAAQDWPDSCLGIQTPGLMCAQHVVNGYLVTLAANGQQFAYRTSADGRDVAAEVALIWTREGGIAGFCDELIVDVTSTATAYSCAAMDDSQVAPQLLAAEPRQQLYDWLNSLQPFEYNQSDSATADSMTVTLSFDGQGSTAADAMQQSDIEAFVSRIYAQMALGETPTPAATETAACTLVANSDVTLYSRPDTASAVFGTLASGEQATMMGQTADGWLGFDPGVAQAANVGIFRLRWVAPGSDVTQTGSCDALAEYPAISPTACYEMAMADATIYTQPDETAASITTLPAGEYTAVTGKTDQDWYQIDLGDGTLAASFSGQTGWLAPADGNFNGQSCGELPIVTP